MTATATDVLRIQIDTREQRPWRFAAEGASVETVTETLPYGDYAACGVPYAIERKSGQDFVASISNGRRRLENELVKMQAGGGGAIVVEADLQTVLTGSPNRRPSGSQRVSESSILGSVASFTLKYGVPVFFPGCRELAERLTYKLLLHAQRNHLRNGETDYDTASEHGAPGADESAAQALAQEA